MNNAHLQPTITEEQYAAAVQRLLVHAESDTGGAKACAQVLLSAYNGYEFQLDITDLCLLDPDLYFSALVAIRGRVELHKEPHELLANGSDRFNALWDQWFPVYHVHNRWKRGE